MSKTIELTPEQSKEHMDDLLEMQADELELRQQRDKLHEKFKDAKDKHESKEKEILQHLESLNQELPLFDDNPGDIPWPFPLPAGDVAQATLANVAADPLVLGLSIGVVKAVKEKCQASTLGELQKYLQADKSFSVDQQTKAKKDLAKLLGPAQTLKLLRGVKSFVQPRQAQAGKAKREAKAEKADPQTAADVKDKAAADNPATWQETPLPSIVGKYGFTAGNVAICTQMGILTVGDLGTVVDGLISATPESGPKNWPQKQFAQKYNTTEKMATALFDAAWECIEDLSHGKPVKKSA